MSVPKAPIFIGKLMLLCDLRTKRRRPEMENAKFQLLRKNWKLSFYKFFKRVFQNFTFEEANERIWFLRKNVFSMCFMLPLHAFLCF